jgi:hypothetical protein
VVGFCAAGPIVAATLRALVDGWRPAGDQAIIATRAFDVFTSHTPLVGQYSDSTAVTGHTVRSLGPMLYWLLALPARFGSPGTLTLTIGLVNVAATIGVVVLARRRGGLAFMFATAIALALMCRSLAPEVLHDVWNPSAGLLPFTLLIFLCWSVACGEYRLLPLTALVASFVVQCQLTYLLPSVGMLAIAIVGLLVSRTSRRAERQTPGGTAHARAPGGAADPGTPGDAADSQAPDAAPDAHTPGGARRGRARWWALAAVVLAIACWTPPIVDQLSEPTGNLTAVIRTAKASNHKLGASVGWHAVERAIGVPPWWLTDPSSPWERKNEVRSAAGTLATVSTLLALCALLAVAALGLLRRRVAESAGALIALTLCFGLAAIAYATPTTRLLGGTLAYTLWWGSPAGMFVWLMLGWSLVRALAQPVRASGRRLTRQWALSFRRSAGLASAIGVGAVAIGVCAVAIVAAAVSIAERPDFHLPEYRPLGGVYAALDRAIPAGRTVRLPGGLGNATFRFKMAARFALVRRGIRPLSPGGNVRLGTWYELRKRPYDCTVYVKDGSARPAPRAEQVARVVFRGPARNYPVTVWVSPAGCPRRAATSR